MPDEGTYLSIIDRIYAAALKPETWGGVMHDIARMVGAGAGDIYIHDQDNQLMFVANEGVPTDSFDEYMTHYHAGNRRAWGLLDAPEGSMANELSYYTPDELKRSAFYEEFLAGDGFQYFMGGTPYRDDGTKTCFGLYFARGHEMPGPDKFDVIRPLMPHLRRALMMQLRLGDADAHAGGLLAALDQMTTGALLLDWRGKVTVCNDAAVRMLETGRSLQVWKGDLCSDDARSNSLIRQAIADALGENKRPRAAPHGGGVVPINDPDERSSLTVFVSALPRQGGEWGHAAAVFITENNPPLTGSGAEEILQTLYGLTPAESRLATSLADGLSIKDHAQWRGVTEGTARVVLKRVFEKTGTGRQAELASLVIRATGALQTE